MDILAGIVPVPMGFVIIGAVLEKRSRLTEGGFLSNSLRKPSTLVIYFPFVGVCDFLYVYSLTVTGSC